MIHINFIAVVVSAILAFVVGFLMHGPVLGKVWMRLANITPTGKEKFSDMYGQMFWNFVVYLVTALGVAIVFSFAIGSGVFFGSMAWVGAVCGLLVWAAFLVPSSSIEVIWLGRSKKLWLFEAFSSLVVMVVMGLMIGAM